MMLWTKCPECGQDFSGRGTEAAQKLFTHRLLEHDEFTDWNAAVESMTDTMQDQSTLTEILQRKKEAPCNTSQS